MFCKKGILRNFAKVTGKHLCKRLFFNKVAGPRPQAFLQNISERRLLILQNNSMTKYSRLVKTQDLLQIYLYSFTVLFRGKLVYHLTCFLSGVIQFHGNFCCTCCMFRLLSVCHTGIYLEGSDYMIDKSLIVFNFYIYRYCLINVIVKDAVEAPSRGVL